MKYILEGSSEVLHKVHLATECDPTLGPCAIHRRTDHHMRHFPQHWRSDRRIFERICPHGVGHPDPDDPNVYGPKASKYEAVHGCDGCCDPMKEST